MWSSLKVSMSRVIKKCLYLREVFKEFIVSYLPVQKQTSRSKCGPFSIVFSAKIFDGKFLNEGSFPVDTGRKLNVLCTFNLRPVSTGFQRHKNERTFGIIPETNIISRNSLNCFWCSIFSIFIWAIFQQLKICINFFWFSFIYR